MTPNDLLTELTYAQVTHRPVLLTGDALADTGAREEDDRGGY